MKTNSYFLSPFLISMLMIICIWIITDIAYGVNMFELEAAAWVNRAKAFGVVVAVFFLANLFFRFTADYFLTRQGPFYMKILATLVALSSKLYSSGIKYIQRSTLAHINGTKDWRIYHDFG